MPERIIKGGRILPKNNANFTGVETEVGQPRRRRRRIGNRPLQPLPPMTQPRTLPVLLPFPNFDLGGVINVDDDFGISMEDMEAMGGSKKPTSYGEQVEASLGVPRTITEVYVPNKKARTN